MGFHQRAEILLYEAMSYSKEPYEAHLQLALLSLDKEDLEKAKIHLKNCLFFRESDIIILIHLAVILIAEGKPHEAKFFISRVLAELESRVQRISSIIRNKHNTDVDMKRLTAAIDHFTLSSWYKLLHCILLY